MRLRRRSLWLLGLLGFTVAALPSVANSATTATVEAISPAYPTPPYWLPEEVAVTTSTGKVTFINSSMTVPHGIVWNNTPATPICEEGPNQVPVGPTKSGYNWKGACTFPQEGVYSYYCSVHGLAMSGKVYVNATGTIPPPPPTATTEAATSVTENGATLKGTVNPNGQATEYFFKYGTTTSYGTETSPQSAGTGTTGVPVSAPASGLAPGTTYHFQLVATYASGSSTVLGGDRTFTTVSPPGAPTATTEAATSVTETGAMLKGMVNPDGETTKYVFNYGTSTSYGPHSAEPTLAATDHTSHPVSAALTGLTPGTTYHFQLVAENKTGASKGADMTFTTTSPPKEEPPPSGGTTTMPTPPVIASSLPKPEEKLATMAPPLVAGSLKLVAPRHGASVRGSIQVSPTGASGRLEVDLLVSSASLGQHGHKPVVVGRLVRSSVPGGKVSFSVRLNARGKSALRRHRRLVLTVKIMLTPAMGAAASATKAVVLRA